MLRFFSRAIVAATLLRLALPAAAETLPVVKVAVTGRPDQAALELAYHRGYFTEQGLDVQFVGGGVGAEEFASALAGGQLQVAAGAPNAALFNAFNRGIDLRIVADWAHVGGADDTTFSFVVRSDLLDSGAVKSAADLKGRTIGVGPSRGSYNEMFIVEMLAQAGLGMADVDGEHLSFPDGIAALAGKKVDGTLLIEPLVMIAAQKQIARVLVTAGAIDPGAQVAAVMYGADFAKNTDLATRYMVAYLRGVRDFNDAFVRNKGRAAAIDVLMQSTTLTLKDRKVWETMPAHEVDADGKVNVAHVKAEAAFYKAQGNISGPIPDIDKFIEPRFAEAAVKILAAQK